VAGDATLNRGADRLPSLDGLRGLSIGLVLLGHALATMPAWPRWLYPIETVAANAELGVSFFFVISGYLITHLLMSERARTGRISLYNFYVRRVTRIIPAYYLYLGCVGLLAAGGCVQVRGKDFFAAAIFLWNYLPWTAGWWLGQSWSLCIEEQFYLLWPATLLMLGPRRALKLALAIIALEPFIRVANYWLWPAARGRIPVMLHTRADILMFGCVLALAHEDRRAGAILERIGRPWIAGLAAVFIFTIDPFLGARWRGAWALPFGMSLEGAGIAAIVWWLMHNPATWAGRLFNRPALMWIGGISYSLYLWQQMFLTPLNRTLSGRFPLNLGCAIGVAAASYYLLERPIMRRRGRLMRPVAVTNSAAADAI